MTKQITPFPLKDVIEIAEVMEKPSGTWVVTCGWIKTAREASKGSVRFIHISDGSTVKTLQVLVTDKYEQFDLIKPRLHPGTSVMLGGMVQQIDDYSKEIAIDGTEGSHFYLLGDSPPMEYPISKKHHTKEHLRTIQHLRCRTTLFSAIFRFRSFLTFQVHKYLFDRGFLQIPAPVITTCDSEGAGELFEVHTSDKQEQFFKKKVFLSCSGQIPLEPFACALGRVYTFNPAFRAEKSNTSKHLSEFWMLEPEMAFYDLDMTIDLAFDLIRELAKAVLEGMKDELDYLDKYNQSTVASTRVRAISECKTQRIKHRDAIDALNKLYPEAKYTYTDDLSSEMEKAITHEVFKDQPVAVTHWPRDIKAFYMRVSDEDRTTVEAFDLLVPQIGELFGGSVREERLDVFLESIKKFKLDAKEYVDIIDTRKFGTIPHAGFGMGFERLLQYFTGTDNIRDVIPYPRYPGHAMS